MLPQYNYRTSSNKSIPVPQVQLLLAKYKYFIKTMAPNSNQECAMLRGNIEKRLGVILTIEKNNRVFTHIKMPTICWHFVGNKI